MFKDLVKSVIELSKKDVVHIGYSQNYDINFDVKADGDILNSDEETPDGEPVLPSETMKQFARGLAECASKLKLYRERVPWGNFRDAGGEEGVADALLRVRFCQNYCD